MMKFKEKLIQQNNKIEIIAIDGNTDIAKEER